MLLQHLIDGLFLGGLYASTALGLTLVFGVMRLVNLAHGEFLIGACYLASVLSTGLALDPLISLVIVAPVMFLLAYPIQRFVLSPLMRSGQEAPLVATFGISLVAIGLLLNISRQPAEPMLAQQMDEPPSEPSRWARVDHADYEARGRGRRTGRTRGLRPVAMTLRGSRHRP